MIKILLKDKSELSLKFLLITFIVLLPTQLAYHFWPDTSLVNGIRVDYLAPAIYLSDIGVILFLLFWFLKKDNLRKLYQAIIFNLWPILIIFSFFVLNIFSAVEPPTSLFKVLKIIELSLLVYTIHKLDFDVVGVIKKPLTFLVIFVVALGLGQVILARTIGTPFYLLGERTFNLQTPGIALVNIFNHNFLRMYSIFPHPNSLAGFLLVLSPFFITWFRQTRSLFYLTGIVALGIGLILCFSLNSIVALFFGLGVFYLLKHLKHKSVAVYFTVTSVFVISLGFLVFAKQISLYLPNLGESYYHRTALGLMGGIVFSENPFWGMGINNFVYLIPQYASLFGNVWFLQPIHNIYLLVLVEGGLFGFVLFYFGVSKVLKKAFWSDNKVLFLGLVFILFLGLSDHYWLTIQQNMLLLSLLVGLTLQRKSSHC